MFAYAAIPVTCWLCALLAIPRRPLPNHEVQEFVYRRLVGQQQILVATATVATVLVVCAILLSAITRA